jgi:hypothetical protein
VVDYIVAIDVTRSRCMLAMAWSFCLVVLSPAKPKRRLLMATTCCSAIRLSTGKMIGLGLNSRPSPIIFGREYTDGDTNTKHCLLSLARRARRSRGVCEEPRVCALAEHVLLRTTTGPALANLRRLLYPLSHLCCLGPMFLFLGCQCVLAHALNGLQRAVTEQSQ